MVEPRLAALVGGVVSALRAAGRTPVPVTDVHGRHWAPAYVLGSLHPEAAVRTRGLDRQAVADVVLDGSGRLALDHPVLITGGALHPLPVSCPSLAESYEHLIRGVRIGDEPLGGPIFLSTDRELMIARPSFGARPLDEYLIGLIQPAVHVASES
ncbi:hypothetical protein [Arthrobacter sp. M4]|uniref:hypothetical protein n=1 Tax=Arthrobacter sp. M4 TaxID=218160 RepID=UPI001CDB6566|nr:hypothetical protein [Arthrobacter sp. M4]MCA4133040.1 hypothetical protein [Arthrobacter sp. M4]